MWATVITADNYSVRQMVLRHAIIFSGFRSILFTLRSDSMPEMSAPRDSRRTDRELAQAVLEHKNELAFRELYRRHTPRLFALVARLLGRGDHEAEDVVQETWIHAFESLGRFQWDSAFPTWLTGIGLNRVRDRIRKYGRSRETGVDAVPDIAVVPASHETRIDLERAISRLSDDQRLVLVLHDVEGMKHREISEHLEIPEGTSKTLLSNARKRLRAMMTGKGAHHD
jgi:RNA polymerase sigma-70 factor (ECF subfamily)